MARTETKTETTATTETITLPKGLTLDAAKKLLGDSEGTEFYHDTAIKYGFGNFRGESFAGGAPALDLSGLDEKQFAALEEKAAKIKAAQTK